MNCFHRDVGRAPAVAYEFDMFLGSMRKIRVPGSG